METGRIPGLRRILVIDDDPVSLAIAAVLLEEKGMQVAQAESGERALEMLAGGDSPDCILADLRMPTLSGSDLAAQLRLRAPSAVLLAMSATPPERVDGYSGVLKKPLSADDILSALATSRGDQIEPNGRMPVAGDAAELDARMLDEAVFNKLRGSMPRKALQEVVDAFIQDARERIEDMRVADAQTVRRQAHTVKGAASMLGAVRVAVTASTVEEGIDHRGERLRKVDELEYFLGKTEVILKQRLKV
jgi:CheY-like chemotaxis protein/HPt (histidine-containing phosphotransfer) domain-containing protein